MNDLAKILVLTFICLQSIANPIGSLITNVIYHITHPLEFISKNTSDDYWFAYSVPAAAKTPSNCCWTQESNNNTERTECDLNKEVKSFRSNNKTFTDKHNIFIHVENKQVSQILPLGEQCKVIADNIEINWLADIDEVQSIEFLKTIAIEQTQELASHSLYAIALHEHEKASEELYKMAKIQKQQLSNNAIFWLGEARNDGVKHLETLYNELPNGEIKKHINFALTQVGDAKSIDLLEEIAVNDNNQAQREDALFWLADLAPKKTKELVFKKLNEQSNASNIDHLIFTLSRLSNNLGDESLFEILTGEYSRSIKKKSLFWLSQSDKSETIDKLQKLL